jgi:hypothetical protein
MYTRHLDQVSLNVQHALAAIQKVDSQR